jgi:predicted N-acetyltransferase YhbS
MSQLVQPDGILVDHILERTHELWNDGLSRPAYARYWQAQLATPWGQRHLSRWALVEDNQVLASAKLYRPNAMLDGRAIDVAGIGAVFTMPEHRRRGAAAELLTRLLDRVAQEGCDAALLFSEIGPEYYARLGFVPVPIAERTLRVVEDERRGAPMMMVRSGEDRDLADIVAMDEARAATARFHLKRDRDLVKFAIAKRRFRAALGPPGLREVQFFVAEEGASAVAYAVISVQGDQWTIDSFGDRDPAGARFGALLQVLIAREPSARRPTITAWMPESFRPPQIAIVSEHPARDVMMIRPLSERGTPSTPIEARDVVYLQGDAF